MARFRQVDRGHLTSSGVSGYTPVRYWTIVITRVVKTLSTKRSALRRSGGPSE